MQGMITKRCLDDIASAIRLRTGASRPITPEEMPGMVRCVYGPPMELTARSRDNSIGLVTDSCMASIADAIREKLGTEDPIEPKDMADAILSIDLYEPFDLIKESTEIARRSQYNTNASGVNRKGTTYDSNAYFFADNDIYPAGHFLNSNQNANTSSMLNALVPAWCTRLFLYMESSGRGGLYNTSTMWFRSAYGVTGYYGGNYAGENVRNSVTFTRYSGTAAQTNEQQGVRISVSSMYSVPKQVVEVDISSVDRDFYVGLHRCDNRTVFYGMVAAWDGFDILSYLGVS